MFKPIAVTADTIKRQAQQTADDSGIKRVFMVLHGYYGNLFFTKFATGMVDGGEDQGIANARRIWSHSLRDFDTDTIKLALRRCQTAHPEYPPSLPQFTAICAAITPRQTYKPAPPAHPAISMSEETRERILAENRRKATEAAHKKLVEDAPKGLDLLKQAIAKAIADGGGDEAAALLQMDRIFTPRTPA
jgi:hypothetical protein